MLDTVLFWPVFAGASLAGLVVAGVYRLLDLTPSIPGMSFRDLPQADDRRRPFDDPVIEEAVRAAYGGWRFVGLIVPFGLAVACVQAAWGSAVPPGAVVHSFWSFMLRTVVSFSAGFWLVGRIATARIQIQLASGRRPAEAAR